VFERDAPTAVVESEGGGEGGPVVFIGHGRDPQWRLLKDHLQDVHGYRVVAFETGARAGHEVRDVLEQMLTESDVALLVLTAEDEQADGSLRARENVVHEAGLFQGRLGFRRAILLLEEGANEFSNVTGLVQLRFPADGIPMILEMSSACCDASSHVEPRKERAKVAPT
jgi:predicted nucleotide-binding protein